METQQNPLAEVANENRELIHYAVVGLIGVADTLQPEERCELLTNVYKALAGKEIIRASRGKSGFIDLLKLRSKYMNEI